MSKGTKFDGAYSHDNLPNKVKDGTYLINLDEYADVGTLRIAISVLNNHATNFDIFGVKHVSGDIRGFIGNKNMQTNIFRIQTY